MKRTAFLTEFLGALGAAKVEFHEVTPTLVKGVAVHMLRGEEDPQEFLWSIAEAGAPSSDARLLAKFLKEKQLLSIDRITLSRTELRAQFQAHIGREYPQDIFEQTLEELLSVEVQMVDGGEITDDYFIHE